MKNFSKTKFFVALLSAFLVCFQFSSQNVLARDSGGGELAEWDAGDWATTQAISLGTTAIGSAIGAGVNSAAAGAAGYPGQSFTTGFSNAVSSWSNASTWGNAFAAGNAAEQVGQAVGRVGMYQGWDPKVTNFASTVASSVAYGAVSPSSYGVGSNPDAVAAEMMPEIFQNAGMESMSRKAISEAAMNGAFAPISNAISKDMTTAMFNGMALGTIDGVIKGSVIAAATNDKGQVEAWAPVVGSYVGGIGTGFVRAGFTQVNNVQPSSYDYVTEVQTTPTPSYQEYVDSGNYIYGPVSKQGYYDAVGGPGGTQVSSSQTTLVPPASTQEANFSFSNDFNWDQAFHGYTTDAGKTILPGAINTATSPANLATSATKLGIAYIADNQDDRKKAMINAAARGLYMGVNAATNYATNYNKMVDAYKKQYKRDAIWQHGAVIKAEDIGYLSSGDPEVTSTYISAISDATGVNQNISANLIGDTLRQEIAQYPRNDHIIYNPQIVDYKASTKGVKLDFDYGKISKELYDSTRK